MAWWYLFELFYQCFLTFQKNTVFCVVFFPGFQNFREICFPSCESEPRVCPLLECEESSQSTGQPEIRTTNRQAGGGVYAGQTGWCVNTRLTEHLKALKALKATPSGHLVTHVRDGVYSGVWSDYCPPAFEGKAGQRNERGRQGWQDSLNGDV